MDEKEQDVSATDEVEVDSKHEQVFIPDILDKTTIYRLAGTLIKVDVNLLAMAFYKCSMEQAVALIRDIHSTTNINLLDPKILENLKAQPGLVDQLQEYETATHNHLSNLIQDYYKENVANDQTTVVRVRYNKFRMWFGAAITTFACAYMLYITIRDLSYADTVLGFLMGTLVSTVVTFYFGSSAKQGDLAENDVVRERYRHTGSAPKDFNHDDNTH